MIDLKNKTALITGGSRGIGSAICLLLAKAGADIAFTFHKDFKSAELLKSQVTGMGRKCLSLKCEINIESDVKKCVESVVNNFSKIDILVNNAGIWTYGEIGNMASENWRETIDINLNSLFYFCNEVTPYMKKRKWGRIINISSTAGQRGEAFHSHYAASKGAMISFTKSLAVELASFNILVNAVAPGWVETDMCTEVFSDPVYKEKVKQSIPLGKIASPEDIAGPVLFLSSELANHITGEILNVNGGSVLCG